MIERLDILDVQYLDPPVRTGSNTQVLANCTLAISDVLTIEGCAIVQTGTRVALWAPSCAQRPGQPHKAIRFGPELVGRVNDIANRVREARIV
tara:strand:- start:13392 stop:13670 length:279 start_codon:yes stop_codon:yes gene_type:complete